MLYIGDVVPTVTIKTYPNQKPWLDGGIRAKLKARITAFNNGKMTGNMAKIQTVVISSKANKLNVGIGTKWSLQAITDYKKINQPRRGHCHLASRQTKHHLCRFDDNTAAPTLSAAKDCGPPLSFSVADMSKTFKRVNSRKAAGPDSIPSRVLRACADQLAGVFTDIFSLSLSQSAVPTCFKISTIVPVSKKSKGN